MIAVIPLSEWGLFPNHPTSDMPGSQLKALNAMHLPIPSPGFRSWHAACMENKHDGRRGWRRWQK